MAITKLTDTEFKETREVDNVYNSEYLLQEKTRLLSRIAEIDALLNRASEVGVAITLEEITTVQEKKVSDNKTK